MPSERFTHIYIAPKLGVTRAMVEKKLDLVRDWFRYDNGLYILCTTSGVDTWKERLRQLVEPGGYLFVCELDISKRKGFMHKDFWAWVKKHT